MKRYYLAIWMSASLVIVNAQNVGVNTATPAATLDINGDIKISGGNPGEGKILSSDAEGKASWIQPSKPIWYSAAAANQITVLIPSTSIHKIMFNTIQSSSGTEYSASQSQFTAPSNGFYRFEVSIKIKTDVAPDSFLITPLFYKTPVGGNSGSASPVFESIYPEPIDKNWKYLHFSHALYLLSGEIIDARLRSSTPSVFITYGGNTEAFKGYFYGYKIN